MTTLSTRYGVSDTWEITGSGSRSFAASGPTLLDVVTALVAATQDDPDNVLSPGLLSDERNAGGLVLSVNFGRDEFEGILTVEV